MHADRQFGVEKAGVPLLDYLLYEAARIGCHGCQHLYQGLYVVQALPTLSFLVSSSPSRLLNSVQTLWTLFRTTTSLQTECLSFHFFSLFSEELTLTLCVFIWNTDLTC